MRSGEAGGVAKQGGVASICIMSHRSIDPIASHKHARVVQAGKGGGGKGGGPKALALALRFVFIWSNEWGGGGS